MTAENQIRLTMFIFLAIGFGISGYYRRKANMTGGDEMPTKEEGLLLQMRTVGALVFYLSLLAFLIYPPLIKWAQVQIPVEYRWTGVAIIGLSVPFIYWLFSNLGNNVTPTVITRAEHQLVTSGPYKYIRHPLYTFGTIMFLGSTLAAANLLMVAGAIVGLGAIFLRTPIEEKKLVDKFGQQYEDYMQKTGRYLPKLF